METFHIAILDDSPDKIHRIQTKFKQRNDKKNNLYDKQYENYTLILHPINVNKTVEEIIGEINRNGFDAIIIDYDLSSFSTTTKNGITIAKQIKEKFSEYPLFILTAYEDRLFQNEIFDAYQIYTYDNYLNNKDTTKELHSRIIQQILKSKKQIKLWEQELNDLSQKSLEERTIKDISRMIDLDNKIERSIDGKSALPSKLKKDLYTNKLDELLKKADEILKE